MKKPSRRRERIARMKRMKDVAIALLSTLVVLFAALVVALSMHGCVGVKQPILRPAEEIMEPAPSTVPPRGAHPRVFPNQRPVLRPPMARPMIVRRTQ